MMHLFHSESNSPFNNIALEESFLEHAADETRLLFWKSRPAVILGKNQNPWLEVNLEYCQEHRVEIDRRFSGGGCVYQDAGNLNYAIIHPRKHYCMERILDCISAAFQDGGVGVERILENALGIDGRKFSGHAFCYRRDRVLHHGTLLVDANLDHLLNSLKPEDVNVATHAVLSRTAPVCNLSEYGLSENRVREFLIRGVESALNLSLEGETWLSSGDFLESDRVDKYSSKEWIWGQTPGFTLAKSLESEEITIRIRKMRIESAVGMDGMTPLIGCSLLNGEVAEILPDLHPASQQVCQSLLAPFLAFPKDPSAAKWIE